MQTQSDLERTDRVRERERERTLRGKEGKEVEKRLIDPLSTARESIGRGGVGLYFISRSFRHFGPVAIA